MQFGSNLDLREFRNALGMFATGVTIITTRGPEGEAVGITANSFSSVSLDPPMILWSLANASRSFPAFDATRFWAVHILSADQEVLSRRFAKSGEDKFTGIDLQAGVGNLPLLTGCAARLQCRTASKFEAGDHLVFIGEVVAFDQCNLPPLIFQAGSYARLAPNSDMSRRRAGKW
jgi:3-hydroxy-9,10-secoandrosta-1,3,5(10)-triene-9,17-dione monooxygenase reductase component